MNYEVNLKVRSMTPAFGCSIERADPARASIIKGDKNITIRPSHPHRQVFETVINDPGVTRREVEFECQDARATLRYTYGVGWANSAGGNISLIRTSQKREAKKRKKSKKSKKSNGSNGEKEKDKCVIL